MGVANTLAGAKVEIGTTAAINFTSDATATVAFQADAYVLINEISNIGEIGPESNIVTFPVISDHFVRKAKGTANAGDPVLLVGYVADDAGQIALRAAEKKPYYYNFRLTLNDAVDDDHDPTVLYFRALVGSAKFGLGGNEDFVTNAYTLGIYPGPVVIPSAVR